jgi:hypothetical protein
MSPRAGLALLLALVVLVAAPSALAAVGSQQGGAPVASPELTEPSGGAGAPSAAKSPEPGASSSRSGATRSQSNSPESPPVAPEEPSGGGDQGADTQAPKSESDSGGDQAAEPAASASSGKLASTGLPLVGLMVAGLGLTMLGGLLRQALAD